MTPFRRGWAVDALRAAAYFSVGLSLLLAVPGIRTTWWVGTLPVPVWTHVAVLAFACCGEMLRRAHPLAGLLVGWLAVLTGIALVGETPIAVLLVAFDLLFYAVRDGSERASRALCWAVGLFATVLALTRLVSDGTEAAVLALLNAALLAIPVLWGREVRHLRERADAERERAEQVRASAVAAERTRMARDLHDVIAGQLSGIAIRSEAALVVPDADPAMLRRVLADVRQDSVASLSEMRTMIGLLRAGGSTEPRTAPAGLERLDTLLDAARSRGQVVDVDDRRPAGCSVPAAADLAAYRIVQESLTNAAKHAPGSPVRLALAADTGTLRIEVHNDEAGPGPASGTGTGLLGLRERAEAVGGRLDAGWVDTGGRRRRWAVRAALPVGSASLPAVAPVQHPS